MKPVKLSLIIPTYNRGERLLKTLDSLVGQSLPNDLWEVVVVNNNSTDGTTALFELFAANHPEINARIVTETGQGVSYARNRGIAESYGEYIVAIDDDEVVVKDFLKEYYNLFEAHPDAMAAGGRILPQYETELPVWMSKYTERPIAGTVDFGDSLILFPEGKFFGGGNMGVRRVMFEKYGVFDTRLGRSGTQLMGGEEKDLYMRFRNTGVKMYYLPDAIIYHLIPAERLTKEYFFRLCRLIGVSERARTLNISQKAYAKRLFLESIKWGGALVLAVGYTLTLRPAKGTMLIKMRWLITKGLLSKQRHK